VPKRNSKPAPVVVSPLPHSWSLHYDVIAIGASAGGLNALIDVLRPVVSDFPPVVIVQHLDPMHKSHLAELLARKTGKQVKEAEHGEPILGAHVYVGPPDEHLLVGPGKIQLVHSQLVHFSRPSIDLLFESIAGMYGSRAIGVVLSGSNRDGATGIQAIREAGGTTIAQEPTTAGFRQMPEAAIDTGCVDFVVPVEELGKMLNRLCNGEKIRS
jgi:two-component system, chemotaxis family, protein-glutamate methylesterase/glutaminase